MTEEISEMKQRIVSLEEDNRQLFMYVSHAAATQNEVKSVGMEIKEIKENHLKNINDQISKIFEKMAKFETNSAWINKFFWIFAAASITGIIGLFVQSFSK